MLEVLGREAARTTPQASSGQGYVRPHGIQLGGIAESVFIDRLMDDRRALSLREQHNERLLPVGHETWMDVRLDVLRFQPGGAVEGKTPIRHIEVSANLTKII